MTSSNFNGSNTIPDVGRKVQEDVVSSDVVATAGAGGKGEIPVVLDSKPSVVDVAFPVAVAEGDCEVVSGCLVGGLR